MHLTPGYTQSRWVGSMGRKKFLDRIEPIRSSDEAVGLQAQLGSVPGAFGGVRYFSHPNTDRPSCGGDEARSVATKDSNERKQTMLARPLTRDR
jgi:hypothetical protein